MSRFGTFIKNYAKGGFSPFSLVSALTGNSSLGVFSSLFNTMTGAGLNGAQREANAFNADQAQKQMTFQQQMRDTQYQSAVQDMQKAGVNPALMYGSGASGNSAPSGAMAASTSPTNGDVVGLLGQIAQLSLLRSQKRNIDADTKNKEQNTAESASRTKINELSAQYYPEVTQANIDSIRNGIKVGESTIKVNESKVLNQDASTALMDSERAINEINKEWLPRLNAAREKSDKAAAAQAYANAAYQSYFTQFTKDHNGQTPGYNDSLALGIAICQTILKAFGKDADSIDFGKLMGEAIESYSGGR